MKGIITLLYYDFLGLIAWFKTQTASKVFILLVFLAVLSGVSLSIFIACKTFFYSLSLSEKYGLLTVKYIIHAAIVIISWFALSTSTISVYGFLVKSDKQFEFLLSYPIKAYLIPLFLFIKSTFMNSLFVLMIFIPIGIAYVNIFQTASFTGFIFRFTFTLILLIVLTNSIASVIGYILAKYIRRKGYLAGILTMSIFMFIMLLIVNIIFPEGINKLYTANNHDFMEIYNNLPLSNSYLPTFWMTEIITQGINIFGIYLSFLTIAILFTSIHFQNNRFLSVFRDLLSHPFSLRSRHKDSYNPTVQFLWNKLPLEFKDLLSITRLPSEIGYAFFLISIDLFFYFLISRIRDVNYFPIQLQYAFMLFVFAWLQFINIAFLLRIVYPLMAKEGPNAWYIFTLPISKLRILFSKIWLALIVSIPFLIFTSFAWMIVPFNKSDHWQFIIISVMSFLTIALANVLFGTIFPNFSQGKDPEKVSTSGMGIVTLFFSFLVIIFSGYLILELQKGLISICMLYLFHLFFIVVTIASLYLISVTNMKKYQF